MSIFENKNPITYDIAVIGGGASGMACAIAAKRSQRTFSASGVSVGIFERNSKFGKKLLLTGNGRCNLTNKNIELSNYHGNNVQFAIDALEKMSSEAVRDFFMEIGLHTFYDNDGKGYPLSLSSSSVLDCLRFSIQDLGIDQHVSTYITGIQKIDDIFTLYTSDDRKFFARTVIIACGGSCSPFTGSDGNGYDLLKAFGHSIVYPIPGIVQLKTDNTIVKPLSGIKINARASLLVDGIEVRSEYGEVLFTDYGLSGPPILQISGLVSRALYQGIADRRKKNVVVSIDLMPQIDEQNVLINLRKRCIQFSKRRLDQLLVGWFHNRIATAVIREATQKPMSSSISELSDAEVVRLAILIKMLQIKITGTMTLQNAQITLGGVKTSELVPVSMESKLCKGLFVCGEIMDIDGDCGGYNLQWAWASGFAAAEGALTYLSETDNDKNS
jgi:hypothetical protein